MYVNSWEIKYPYVAEHLGPGRSPKKLDVPLMETSEFYVNHEELSMFPVSFWPE